MLFKIAQLLVHSKLVGFRKGPLLVGINLLVSKPVKKETKQTNVLLKL